MYISISEAQTVKESSYQDAFEGHGADVYRITIHERHTTVYDGYVPEDMMEVGVAYAIKMWRDLKDSIIAADESFAEREAEKQAAEAAETERERAEDRARARRAAGALIDDGDEDD
jgi:hypothetical protein